MRRHVDPDGRVYRSIKSGGRVYTYYDDDPVAPTDVWNDLSHLQQRDPERTGYDTQKPLSLLERIVKCGSRAGEIVLRMADDLNDSACALLSQDPENLDSIIEITDQVHAYRDAIEVLLGAPFGSIWLYDMPKLVGDLHRVMSALGEIGGK